MPNFPYKKLINVIEIAKKYFEDQNNGNPYYPTNTDQKTKVLIDQAYLHYKESEEAAAYLFSQYFHLWVNCRDAKMFIYQHTRKFDENSNQFVDAFTDLVLNLSPDDWLVEDKNSEHGKCWNTLLVSFQKYLLSFIHYSIHSENPEFRSQRYLVKLIKLFLAKDKIIKACSLNDYWRFSGIIFSAKNEEVILDYLDHLRYLLIDKKREITNVELIFGLNFFDKILTNETNMFFGVKVKKVISDEQAVILMTPVYKLFQDLLLERDAESCAKFIAYQFSSYTTIRHLNTTISKILSSNVTPKLRTLTIDFIYSIFMNDAIDDKVKSIFMSAPFLNSLDRTIGTYAIFNYLKDTQDSDKSQKVMGWLLDKPVSASLKTLIDKAYSVEEQKRLLNHYRLANGITIKNETDEFNESTPLLTVQYPKYL